MRDARTPVTGTGNAVGAGSRDSSHSARGLAMKGCCQAQCAKAAAMASANTATTSPRTAVV